MSHRKRTPIGDTKSSSMNEFGVLTSRKRALIALIHSVIFLGVAAHGFLSPKAGLWYGRVPVFDFVLIGIYLVVATILGGLVRVSRCAVERIYFGLCAGSAAFGFLRTMFGDKTIPAAQYLRVILLSSAAAICLWIVRAFTRSSTEILTG
jgi:hypothetical protein